MQTLSEMTASQWSKAAAVALALFALFQGCVTIGQLSGAYVERHQGMDLIERRVSLDLAYLDVGNQTLNTPVNDAAVLRYLSRINGALFEQNFPLYINQIQHVSIDSQPSQDWTATTMMKLETAEQQILIGLTMKPLYHALAIHPLAILAALVIAPVLIGVKPRPRYRKASAKDIPPPPEPKLVIDLNTKSIGNGVDGRAILMQNKPFCFYTALVRYCIENPEATLPQNKDVPQELINLANRVFLRLIELGHTKRKKPDFNANLDKTLSEIRAALDETFEPFLAEKEKYYPPRAQGEGSRSKQHSYALPPITEEDIIVIGK